MSQKRIIALHDLSCLGRAALTQVILALGAMGHQPVPLPTAVFSTHMGFAGYQTQDLTAWLSCALTQYVQLGQTFDGVLIGYLHQAGQMEQAKRALQLCTAEGVRLLDPVMGDNGKVYASCTVEKVEFLRELAQMAHIITPNVTEAALLLDKDPTQTPQTVAQAQQWAQDLQVRYGGAVVLTGVALPENQLATVTAQADGCTAHIQQRLAAYYPGTGDLFATVLLGAVLQGKTVAQASVKAADFVGAAIAHTVDAGTEPMQGVQLEKVLHLLVAQGK